MYLVTCPSAFVCDRLCLHFSRTCLLLKNPVLRLQSMWDMGQEWSTKPSYRDDAGMQVPKCPCFKMLAIVMRSFKGGDEGHITAPSLLQSKACSPVVNMCKAHEMFLLIQLPGSASGTLQWVLCTWSGARAFQRPSKQSLYLQTCESLCACDSQKYPPHLPFSEHIPYN